MNTTAPIASHTIAPILASESALKGVADDQEAEARTHGAIDFEHITTAMRRAGVLSD
jgi:hypothetical protein